MTAQGFPARAAADMTRYPAIEIAALLATYAGGPGASAATSRGSYDVHVLPDPTRDVSPYGPCGAADAWVVAAEVGRDARAFRLPARSTLTAELVPELNVFAGDVGLDWTLLVVDRAGNELGRSHGPAWQTRVTARTSTARDVLLVACNGRGHPDATISWSVRR
jgi:hypothetical protein